MRAQGAASLTASGIAKAAGIAPQNFYVYFENAEECIGLAVETVASHMRTVISALRADMHRTAPADAEILAQHYEQVLNLIVAEGRLWEIFSRFHRDFSPLGVALRHIALQGRTDLVTDLWRLAQSYGYSEAYRNLVEIQAEIIVASIHGVAEALVDGRIHDVRTASVALAQGTIHATQTLFATATVQTST
jgi:AcrR family transcriptional regulator